VIPKATFLIKKYFTFYALWSSFSRILSSKEYNKSPKK